MSKYQFNNRHNAYEDDSYFDEEDWGRGKKLNKQNVRNARKKKTNDRYASFDEKIDDRDDYDFGEDSY